MRCPSCKKSHLKPGKLEYALPALTCIKCHGVLISLLVYRDWAERHAEVVEKKSRYTVRAEDNKNVLLCPKCGRLMTKYNISGEHDNKVDLCNSCDEAWLDDGEWKILKYLKLEDKLATIFTEPWQRNLRKEVEKESREDKARELLQNDYEKIKELKSWIKNHKFSIQIKKYLNEE